MKFETVTIKDIARALGLSTSTVSRALRGSYEISPETKKLVLEYAEKINYRPNPIALSLKERKSRSIGVVVSEIANTFFSQAINGIESIVNNNQQAVPYELFNIGNSKPVKLLDFINAIETTLGVKAQIEMLPMQEGDVKVTYADTTKLFEKYRYKPSTDIADGIAKFVDWYKEFYLPASKKLTPVSQ